MIATLLQRGMSAIGVDFGACSLRAVQLRRAGQRWRIHHWLNMESEPHSAEPPPFDHAAELRAVLGPGTFSGSRTVLLLNPPEVEFRLLDIPQALLERPADELRSSLQFELDRQLPWSAAEAEVCACTDGRSGGSGETMVVAARSGGVQRWLDILEGQGLECLRADVLPSAMSHVCGPASADPAVWGVLDVGFTSSRLYLLHNRHAVYARVMRGGGRELTETLAKALRVEYRIAEQYKRIYGIRQSERGVRSAVSGLGKISEQDLPGVLYAIVRPILESMVSEMERSYRFAIGRIPGAAAGPVFLVGGGARLAGLRETLQAQLGIAVCLPDLSGVLDAASAGSSTSAHPACSPMNLPVLAGCIGLALREEQP